MDLKALIFDLDGTIADTVPLTILSIKETVKQFTGRTLSDEEVLAEFGPIDTEIVRKLVNSEESDAAIEEYVAHFDNHFEEYVPIIDGMEELLKCIKNKGIKLGLYTGRGLRVANIVLARLGFDKYFDLLLAGDHVTKPKPDPEGILLACNKLGVEPCDAAYIGDFDVDIVAARKAGTTAVLALWASNASGNLIEHKPDHSFKKASEFMEWLTDKANS